MGIPKGWVARSLETLLWLPEKCHKLSLVDLVRFFIQKLMSGMRVLVTMQTCLITPHRAPQVQVAHGKIAMDLCTITTSSITSFWMLLMGAWRTYCKCHWLILGCGLLPPAQPSGFFLYRTPWRIRRSHLANPLVVWDMSIHYHPPLWERCSPQVRMPKPSSSCIILEDQLGFAALKPVILCYFIRNSFAGLITLPFPLKTLWFSCVFLCVLFPYEYKCVFCNRCSTFPPRYGPKASTVNLSNAWVAPKYGFWLWEEYKRYNKKQGTS